MEVRRSGGGGGGGRIGRLRPCFLFSFGHRQYGGFALLVSYRTERSLLAFNLFEGRPPLPCAASNSRECVG